MNMSHYFEEQSAWFSRADHFDGFDRGDSLCDYDEQQQAMNEAFAAENPGLLEQPLNFD